MSARRDAWLLLAPVLVFLGAFYLAPVGNFLMQGFFAREGGLTLQHVERLVTAGTYTQVMWASVKIAVWVTLFSILVGYPVAYVLARAGRSGRSTWVLFVLLPFWSSFLVRTFAWIVIFGRQGPVNVSLIDLGLIGGPQEFLYTWGAVVIGMTNVLVPFAILTMLGVMEGIDPALMRAAGTLGAHPVQAFFRVYLPLSMPGVTAAALLVFITALGFFIAPALLGSARQTMIAQLLIQQVIELTNWPFAAIICLLLLATALAIFWGFDRAVGLSTLAGEQRVSATRSAPARLLGRWMQGGAWMLGDAIALVARRVGSGYLTPTASAPLRALAVLILIFLILPLAFLAPISVSTRGYVAWPPQGFTWMWYANVLASPLWTAAAIRSFIVALLTALVCFLIAVPAAFAFLRLSGRTAAALFALIVSPLIVPRMVIAIALFYVYARLGLVGSTLGLVIGHAIIALPFFFVAVIAALKTYDRRLDAAAASLGAGPWRTARLITLPLIGTGLLSATLFAFVISFDELNVALFASGGLQSTLPKLMWDEATLRFSPVLAAVSTLLLAVMSVVVLIAARLQSAGQE